MKKDSKIFVAGHNGMVGSAVVRQLQKLGYTNIITASHKELDLTNQQAVNEYFTNNHIEYVFLCAAKVGGIYANNNYPADFMYQNMMIEMNVINAAFVNKVTKLLFLGSSCIYPKNCPQPIKEKYLLTGELEQTNEAYALAKISGLKYCEYLRKQYGVNFISAMPTNLYGPNDNYDSLNAHVLPALIRRFHEAKLENKEFVECWGDGSPLREFMHVDDTAKVLIYLMNNYNETETINVGNGQEYSIKEITNIVCKIVNYKGEIKWDTSKPNGTPRKLLDLSKLKSIGYNMNFISIEDGILDTYNDFLTNKNLRLHR